MRCGKSLAVLLLALLAAALTAVLIMYWGGFYTTFTETVNHLKPEEGDGIRWFAYFTKYSFTLKVVSLKTFHQDLALFPLRTKTKCTPSVAVRTAAHGAAPRRMRTTTTLRAAGWRGAPPQAGATRTAPPAGQGVELTACSPGWEHGMDILTLPVQPCTMTILGATPAQSVGVTARMVAQVKFDRHEYHQLNCTTQPQPMLCVTHFWTQHPPTHHPPLVSGKTQNFQFEANLTKLKLSKIRTATLWTNTTWLPRPPSWRTSP